MVFEVNIRRKLAEKVSPFWTNNPCHSFLGGSRLRANGKHYDKEKQCVASNSPNPLLLCACRSNQTKNVISGWDLGNLYIEVNQKILDKYNQNLHVKVMITKKKNPHDVHWHLIFDPLQGTDHIRSHLTTSWWWGWTHWPYGHMGHGRKIWRLRFYGKKRNPMLQSAIFNEGLFHQKLSVDIANLRLWCFASWCAS